MYPVYEQHAAAENDLYMHVYVPFIGVVVVVAGDGVVEYSGVWVTLLIYPENIL